MSNILAILVFSGALEMVLAGIAKDWKAGKISVFRRGSGASVQRDKSPLVFWIALCVEGLLALALLGGLGFNFYLAWLAMNR